MVFAKGQDRVARAAVCDPEYGKNKWQFVGQTSRGFYGILCTIYVCMYVCVYIYIVNSVIIYSDIINH